MRIGANICDQIGHLDGAMTTDNPPDADARDQEPVAPFWRAKTLEQLDAREWEQLCDGCGRCCLLKLEDEDSGELHYTKLSCRLLDIGSCRCRDYDNRHTIVSDCVRIDAAAVRTLRWLPDTCGYRLVAEGRELAWWHPLISGDPDTVHAAGISVRHLARSEVGARLRDFERYIIAALPAGRVADPAEPVASKAAEVASDKTRRGRKSSQTPKASRNPKSS